LFTTDSLGNIYFPAGVSVGNYPIINSTPTHILIPGPTGLISRVPISQLVSTSPVTSVFGRTGAVLAVPGDYDTDAIKENNNLYFTVNRARASISLTALGTTGPATYNPVTGVINVPQYQNEFSGVNTFNNRVGDVVLTALDVTTALTYTPIGVETDPVWAAQKVLYYTKVESDARFAAIVHTHTTSQVIEDTNLYYTDARARAAISLTTNGTSGVSTYINGVFNIPNYTTDLTGYATEIYVNTQVSNLVDAAPTTLNTLNELAAALGDDANFSTTVTDLIGTKEPAIAPGTTAQYWRGDKSWQTLPIYNLSLYVPYTGATGAVDLGTHSLSANNLTANGGTNAGRLELKNANAASTIRSGYFVLSPSSTSTSINFGFSTGATTWKSCTFSSHLLTDNTPTIYSLPNGSGTLALTSDIVSYTLPTASATVLGGIKVGSNLSIDANGILSAENSYVLPTASASVLGGIKVGTNLSIDANGVLSSTDTNTTYADFTRTVAGLVPNPGGSSTDRYLREDGTWVVPPDTDTDTNTFVTSAAFSEGTLTLTRNDTNTVTVSLDGRYYLASNPSEYITSASLGAYLPLAGGTMTGAITTPNGTFGIIVGDDSRLADRNIANTLFLEGVQNNDRGYINFSQTTGNALGAVNGGSLTWRDNVVLDAANYNLYSPTLTGDNASGTWSIEITGNAGSITNQANSATITASTDVTASNIVQRDANGYIYANYINFNTSESENPTISSFFTSNGDGWSRKSSIAHVRDQLGNYGGWITGITSTMVTDALGYTPGTGGISGSGSAFVVPAFTGPSSIGNSTITQLSSGQVIVGTLPNDILNIRTLSVAGTGLFTSTLTALQSVIVSASVVASALAISGFSASVPIAHIDSNRFENSASFGLLVDGGTSQNDYALRVRNANETELFKISGNGYSIFSNNVIIGSASDNGTKFRILGPNALGTFFDAQNDGAAGATFQRIGNSFPFNQYTFANGNVIVGGSVTAISFFESSDATLKTLVEDNYQAKGIDSVVAKLYIKNGKQELGYYAQDLEGVLPSAVSKGSNGLLNLSYREVHTAKIAYLEEKIKKLEKLLSNGLG
jgi:hypothetical protein